MSKRIGISGGTFSPIHNAVLKVARKARTQHSLDKILLIPNGQPPHKTNVLDKEIRFEMVQAAVANEPGLEASRIEIDRPGQTWSIDTLRALKQLDEYKDAEFFFIIGEDNIAAFKVYEHRLEFYKLATLLVAPRKFANQSDLDKWRQELPEATIELIDCEADGLSATQIRQLVKEGKSISEHVPAAVEKIISERGLYKDQPPAAPEAKAA